MKFRTLFIGTISLFLTAAQGLISMTNNAVQIAELQQLLNQKETPFGSFTPLPDEKIFSPTADESNEERAIGEMLLREGKVGAIVMAGGSGTRLGWKGPKGTFPVTCVKQKSLFQLFAERAEAAKNAYQAPLPIAFMTSDDNIEETESFFREHDYFGADKSQIQFYSQSSLPLLTIDGNIILGKDGTPVTGPDGNGRTLYHFVESGLFKKWKEMGIEYVTVMTIDNALIDPFDTALIGRHALMQQDITVKGIMRKDPLERVGVLVDQEGTIGVVEYSEMPEEEKTAETKNGTLVHKAANISFFCFSMSFIENTALEPSALPLHKASKMLPEEIALKNGLPQQKIWKFEYFIFDLLRLTTKAQVVVAPREECFAPLKNASGQDSITTVRELLLAYDKSVFKKISGIDLNNGEMKDQNIELSPRFYYPTPELKAKWKNRSPEGNYID